MDDIIRKSLEAGLSCEQELAAHFKSLVQGDERALDGNRASLAECQRKIRVFEEALAE